MALAAALTALRLEVSAEFRTTPYGDRRPPVQLGCYLRLLLRWPSRREGQSRSVTWLLLEVSSMAGGDSPPVPPQARHGYAEGVGGGGEEEARGDGEGGGAERGEDTSAPPRHSLLFLVPGEEGGEAKKEKKEEEAF